MATNPADDVVGIYNYYPVDGSYTRNFHKFLEWTSESFKSVFVTHPPDLKLPHATMANLVEVPNHNQDFGSLSHVVGNYWTEIEGNHIFVANSSVLGPFAQGIEKPGNWLGLYKERLVGNVGLAGDSLNPGRLWMPHTIEFKRKYGAEARADSIQTTNFILSSDAAKLLRAAGFFDTRSRLTKREIVADYEIGLSQSVKALGLELAEVRKPKTRQISLGYLLTGDPHSKYANWLCKPQPHDYVFLKTNRGLYSEAQIRDFCLNNPLNFDGGPRSWAD